MQPSKLSEVLRGVRGLSKDTARKVIKNLSLSESEGTLFLNLLDLHQTKSALVRRNAESNLELYEESNEYGELSLERFKIIADWHHFAILELTEIVPFDSSPAWIAERLGISLKVTREAIERLISFGLLKRDAAGQLRQTSANLATPTGIPSSEIREHHSQILMKADSALHSSDIHERDFSTITLAFNSQQMEEVKNELKALRRRLGKKIQDHSGKDRVYCLSIQFFPVDKKTIKSRKSFGEN
jgi:uncharacterized protein (TIGR02147 family)